MLLQQMGLAEAEASCRRLGTSLKAGVDILRAISVEQRLGSPKYRRNMGVVETAIREGNSLSEAMVQCGKYFPPMMIQLVYAGETAGKLNETLLHLADYFLDLKKTRSDFLRQIAWPVLQLVLGLGIISATILIQGMLAPANGQKGYDAASLGLSGVSGFIVFWMIVLLFFGTMGLIGFGLLKNWFNCHQYLLPVIQKIPGIGTPLETLSLTRMTMSLSMLLNAGVDAQRAVKQSFWSTGNYYLISGMDRALAAIGRGDSFGESFRAAGVFPREFIEAVEIGELSGTESESLERLSKQYQERARAALSALAMICSGAIWLIITVIIAFMIIRMAMQYINLLNNPFGD